MPRRKYPKGLYWIIFLLLLVPSLVIIYWVTFYTTGAVKVTENNAYIAFQEAFPLADGWAGLASLISLIGILRRENWGFLFGIISGASLIVIALMDVLYNINSGQYALLASNSSMGFELFLNLLCFYVGIHFIWYMWKHRNYFK